jgi:hypothetical protein
VSEPDVVATNSGYPCRYYPTALSGPVFRWAHPGDPEFGVSAGRDGVMLHGLSPRFTPETLSDLLDVLDLAGVVADNLGRRPPAGRHRRGRREADARRVRAGRGDARHEVPPDLETLGCRVVPSMDPLYLDPFLPPAVGVVTATTPPPAPAPPPSVLAGTWFEAIAQPYVRDPETGTVISGSP